MSFFTTLYKKLPQPENWKVWITISLIVKTLFFVYFINLASSLPDDYAGFNYKGSWALEGGDTKSYLNQLRIY